jgi:1-aminocyclopropane-1-carboxylate deaminase
MLVQPLNATPVLGVRLDNIAVARLDLGNPPAGGNKYFKLKANLELAQSQGIRRLVTFGGAWSNHIHALAAVGRETGIETVGIIRGEETQTLCATLLDARNWGMNLVFVSRSEYRRRHEADYVHALQKQYSPCMVIPEGGANDAGVEGCVGIPALLGEHLQPRGLVALACGTGTTMAGVARGLPASCSALGIAVLKGHRSLEPDISRAIAAIATIAATDAEQHLNWRIDHRWHCGGYARVSAQLKQFILTFEAIQGIPLDPVYTGKMMYGLHQLRACGEISAVQSVLALHTGGLQGRRGYTWLAAG